MSILRLTHDEGIQRMAELLLEENLVPIIGSGFSKGCSSHGGTVPDGFLAKELMKNIISEFKLINWSNDNFNKISERFFSIVPKKRQWDFFKRYFTKVQLTDYLQEFLSLPWPYIYTLNIDDGIENTKLYTSVLPYHNANLPTTSMKLLYKLHGDANYEVLYEVENNIVFSSKQYIDFLTSGSNKTIINAISSDYKQKNLLFIGCSLDYEPDLQYIYNHSKDDIPPNMMRCVIRSNDLSDEEELDLEEYGINSIIVVRDYELFYRELVDKVNKLSAKFKSNIYQFTNPKHIYLNEKDLEENLAYFSGKKIFNEDENNFYKPQLHVARTCVHEIEAQLRNHSSVIIRGRRFSGKTFIMSLLAERFKKFTVLYFPSEITIDEDILMNLLKHEANSIFLFDSNSLTNYAYHHVANSGKLLQSNHNKLVVAINSNDLYLSDALNAETIIIPPVFDPNELFALNPISDKFGLVKRNDKETNMDYLKKLADEQKIPLSLFNKFPKVFTEDEVVVLILLSIKDKLYYSDISALDLRFGAIDKLIDRMQGIIEKVPVSKGERCHHSKEKLVHNSKYYMLHIMRNLSSKEIIRAILYIVSHLVNDPAKKRLYVEAVLFDTLNQLFGGSEGSGKLIFDIYDGLSVYLSHDMDYWLQRAKSIYRLKSNSYNDLMDAYQYAKKALGDGNLHLKAKASLTTSLICCLIAKLCTDPLEVDCYEKEAVLCANNAITSSFFSINRSNLRGELRYGHRQPYSQLIRDVCDKQLANSENLQIMWEASNVKKLLDELEAKF